MIRLRNPRTDDPVIFKLIQKELIPFSYTVDDNDSQAIRDLPKRFRLGTTYVEAQGKTSPPAGFIHFQLTGDILFVDMLVVQPASRDRGVGRRLMAACEAHGLAHSCVAARLFVDKSNPRAHRFYEKLGYRTSRYFHELRCFEMFKWLV